MPSNLLFEQPPGKPLVVQRDAEMFCEQLEARALYHHAQRSDVIVEPTRDGNEYHVACYRHAWAAPPVQRFEDCGTCPQCAAEDDAEDGHARYLRLLQVGAVREGR